MKPAIKYDTYYTKYNPDEITVGTLKLKLGVFTGVTIHTIYELCERFNIDILSSEKLGGFIVKDYRVKVKGKRKDIRRLMDYLDDF